MSILRLLYDIFFEGCTHYSIAKINQSGGLGYYTEEGIPILAQIQDHLNGEVTLGSYNLLPNSTCRWMAFDIDSKKHGIKKARDLAKKICDLLDEAGIPYIVEWSGNKGYHIIIIFDREYPAVEIKAVGDAIRDRLGLPKTGDPHVEVYPKQDRLTESNPRGSLLRLPLGYHPSTNNRTMFVDPDNGWEQGPERDPEKLLEYRTSLDDLRAVLGEQSPADTIISLMAPYWVSGERHNLSLYLSGYMAVSGWSEEATYAVIEDLAEGSEGGSLENQLECVRDTFKNHREGKRLMGQQGLADTLPVNVMRQLSAAITSGVTSSILHTIDSIRLEKGTAWQKSRLCANTIITYFKERGKLVRDENTVYWLDRDSHRLLSFEGQGWYVFMHTNFGLNPTESFGNQVLRAVELYALQDAEVVKVHKRTYWKDGKVRINLGGPEVYVVDGSGTISLSYNGEDGCLFLNSEDFMNVPNLLDDSIEPVNVWDFLVNDLNYKAGSNTPASPEQQKALLTALILCTFFAEAMPTRPILAFLAEAGSGKTTAARRILKILEGPDEDVLGLVHDKPDSLRASVIAHRIVVLDNLEKTRANWLPDMLNRLSTGAQIEVRKLFKTNEMMKLAPNCFMVLTATDMPFSEETVFSRMLPIELAKLMQSMPEGVIRDKLTKNYNGYWKHLLYCVDEAVREMNANNIVDAPNESRLADFTVFCSRIKGVSFIDEEDLMGGLDAMIAQQKQALRLSSPFVAVLDLWIKSRPEEASNFNTMADLFAATQRFAISNRMEWRWSSPAGLSKHIQALEQQLIQSFGMSVQLKRQGGREVRKYKFDRAKIVQE